MKIVTVLIAIASVFVACEPGVLNPPSNTSNSEYPCGIQGKVCPDQMCCWRGDDCGGDIGCPAGYCCFNGDDTAFGAVKPYVQMSKDEAKTRMSKPR